MLNWKAGIVLVFGPSLADFKVPTGYIACRVEEISGNL